VHADAGDVERYNLGRSFDDENVFRDAVSGYLLMRGRANA
jgi:hypothetical protein